jgi:hypothetical protein
VILEYARNQNQHQNISGILRMKKTALLLSLSLLISNMCFSQKREVSLDEGITLKIFSIMDQVGVLFNPNGDINVRTLTE